MGTQFRNRKKTIRLAILMAVIVICCVVILAFVFSNLSYSARALEVTSEECSVAAGRCYFLISNPFNTKQYVTDVKIVDNSTNLVLENIATSFQLTASSAGNLTVTLPANATIGESIAYFIGFSNGESVSGILTAH